MDNFVKNLINNLKDNIKTLRELEEKVPEDVKNAYFALIALNETLLLAIEDEDKINESVKKEIIEAHESTTNFIKLLKTAK